jgi:hypothetical protein
MAFDHRPGTDKQFEVSQGLSLARERVQAEIAKCDIVCANCHAIRTWQRDHIKRWKENL